MAGLSLSTSLRAGGTYTPMTPASAMTPSASRTTIGQAAYGVSGTGADVGGPRTAGYGTVAAGIVSMLILGFLWWSLPR
jgi:hypothetical protein